MDTTLSPQFLIVQFGSLVHYLRKAVDTGSLSQTELDVMTNLNDLVRDCILLQKNLKLQKLKIEILAHLDDLVSPQDQNKIKAVAETLQPVFTVSRERVARITGTSDIRWEFNLAVSTGNITSIYETLKARLADPATANEEIPGPILFSIEAACEVTRRLIMQEHVKLRSAGR